MGVILITKEILIKQNNNKSLSLVLYLDID